MKKRFILALIVLVAVTATATALNDQGVPTESDSPPSTISHDECTAEYWACTVGGEWELLCRIQFELCRALPR